MYTSYALEHELVSLSEQAPTIAFLNCNRMIKGAEEVPRVSPKLELTEDNKLVFVYATGYGQAMRSYNSTASFV